MGCSIMSPDLSLLMKHLVIGQRQKLKISRLFIGYQAVVCFPLVSMSYHEGSTFTKRAETSLNTEADLISESDQAVRAVHSCNSWLMLTNLMVKYLMEYLMENLMSFYSL